MSYMIKGKEAAWDAYVGVSESYLVIVPYDKVTWYYQSTEITDAELWDNLSPLTADHPIDAPDILPVYRIS